MTLYLTDNTSPDEVKRAKESGFVHAFKYYPAGATTNADRGVSKLERAYAALAEMESEDVVLCVHGEVTDADVDVFDRERVFVDRQLAQVVSDFPGLRVVVEHITTREAAQFVADAGPNVAATITPQHLLYSRNALFAGGLRPHLYCLPILKRERTARRWLRPQRRAIANSSSAPTARRMLAIPRKAPADAPAAIRRRLRCRSTQRRSRTPKRSTASRGSRAGLVRTSIDCRATSGK